MLRYLLLSSWLDPDLVLRVGSEEVKGSDVESELAGLRELSETCSKRDQIVTGNIRGLENVVYIILNIRKHQI